MPQVKNLFKKSVTQGHMIYHSFFEISNHVPLGIKQLLQKFYNIIICLPAS